MTQSPHETVERFFTHLSARKWSDLASLLDDQVERIGPFGDRVVGRDTYMAFLRGVVPSEYGNDVSQIVVSSDGRSAFAKVTESLRYPDRELHLDEAYFFDIADNGLITRIEVYWQTPERDPGGFGSATSDDSYVSQVSGSPDG